ncbi:MAG: TlpA disulfide reductase family protein [Oscillospiraceae bacterium]
MQKSMDGDMSMPAGSDTSTPPDDGSMQKFPAFEGKDLDGNTVKSDELFSGNAVTVVNFWFTTCNPCVGELAELDALNKELAEKGGSLIGVNTFTLDGDEAAISRRRRTCWPRRAPPIRMCILTPMVRRESLLPTSLLIPPPMWSTAAAISWVNPS